MNICFIIDPWETLQPEEDSTMRMIYESLVRLPPKHVTRSFIKPSEPNPIIDYVLQGIK
jgi:hypothetical protein